jgi:hypothetical protein
MKLADNNYVRQAYKIVKCVVYVKIIVRLKLFVENKKKKALGSPF